MRSATWGRFSEIAESVMAFHKSFNLPRKAIPSNDINGHLIELRINLMEEELEEYKASARVGDVIGIADALGDIVYAAFGAAITYGIDLDAVVREVHRANMSKLDGEGRAMLREDGKVLKSKRYTPPNIEKVLLKQKPLPIGDYHEPISP